MTPASPLCDRPRARSTRARLATLAVAAGAVLVPAAAHAGGGAAPSSDLLILSVTGPGEMTTTGGIYSFFIRNEGVFRWSEPPVQVFLSATPNGNNAEFAGWQGDCAHEALNPTCTTMGPASIGFAGTTRRQGTTANAESCRWVGAAFKYPGEPTPVMRNPCASATPGGGGSSPGGGSGAPGGPSGQGGGGGQATPGPGTVLAGGVTTVRKAPPLQRTRVSVTGTRLATTGAAPRGTTRVVQSLTLIGNAGVSVAGRCRLTRASGAFTCAASPPRGRWTVITQARKGSAVIAQTTRTVRVR